DLGRDAFRRELARRGGDAPRACWAAQGDPDTGPDLWDELASLRGERGARAGTNWIAESVEPHLGEARAELERRLDGMAAAVADPEVDVVQCLQGGYGSAQAVPHIDFDVVASNPKPFVGYSDITALHVALRQRTGLATLYGYGLIGVGDKETTEFTRRRLLDVL